jgi:predicted TPR repeat methyltransferase
MQTAAEQFDLVLAADLFIYIGDLTELFTAAKSILRGGALFAFSIEAAQESYLLRRTRRYAQSLDYIRDLAKMNGFDVVEATPLDIRQGDDGPVAGHVIVLKRTS